VSDRVIAPAPPPASPTVLVRQAAVRPAAVRPVTSILGVLRRPQTQADRDPTLLWQLARQARDPVAVGLLGTPLASFVRRATVAPWGQRIFLTVNLSRTRRQLARLPAKWRGVTVVHQVSVAMYPLSSGQAIPAVIEAGRAWADESSHGSRHADDRFVFLIPDGVGEIALWNATSIAAHPHPLVRRHSQPVRVNVHGNVAAFSSKAFRSPGHEVWYGPTGNVVRRIPNASSCAPPLGNCA
jgi:hypothetical protein